MQSSAAPRINWLAIFFAALLGGAMLLFIAWTITSQAYRQWSSGVPISGGWNWPMVIALDFACVLIACAACWKIYCDAKTIIGSKGISQPSLFGMRIIAWSEVTDVQVFNGVGYHIYAGKRKIVVSPYVYKNSEGVIEMLRINVLAGRNGT